MILELFFPLSLMPYSHVCLLNAGLIPYCPFDAASAFDTVAQAGMLNMGRKRWKTSRKCDFMTPKLKMSRNNPLDVFNLFTYTHIHPYSYTYIDIGGSVFVGGVCEGLSESCESSSIILQCLNCKPSRMTTTFLCFPIVISYLALEMARKIVKNCLCS